MQGHPLATGQDHKNAFFVLKEIHAAHYCAIVLDLLKAVHLGHEKKGILPIGWLSKLFELILDICQSMTNDNSLTNGYWANRAKMFVLRGTVLESLGL